MEWPTRKLEHCVENARWRPSAGEQCFNANHSQLPCCGSVCFRVASNRALRALGGTALHVLLVGELSALLAAVVASLGSSFADERWQLPVPRDDVGRDGADVAVIRAQLHRLDMLFVTFAFTKKRGTCTAGRRVRWGILGFVLHPACIFDRLDCAGNFDVVEFGCGYGTFTIPAAR
jgi:hypothetical protein